MRGFCLAIALLTASCASVRTPSQQLAAIAEEHWQHQLAGDVATRSQLGLPIEPFPDVSYAAAQRDAEFARSLLTRLEQIDAAALSEEEQTSLALLKHLQMQTIDGLPHFWLQFPVTPYASPISQVQIAMGRVRLETEADQQRYLRLLEAYARFLDGITAVLSEQRTRGILIPRRELPLARTLLTSDALMLTTARLQSFPEHERTAYLEEVRNAIAQRVAPSLNRLKELLGEQYEAAAPQAVGIGNLPGGKEAYRYLIRAHTSYQLAPEELHRLGRSELARIEEELKVVRAQMGFRGKPSDFYAFLQEYWRTRGAFADPQQHFTSYVRRVEPHVDRFFSITPEAPYDTRRLAPALEASMTFGYYQRPTSTDPAGHYYFNGSPSKPRSVTFGGALMAHELIPGHHFQIARQLESEQLPQFRRQRYDTAFIEGWGEYAAILAGEMGLYAEPPDRAGRLLMDLLLSTRLVVDTGLNALGWTYDQARDFMREHTPLTDEEINTEILRYSVDIPGQALAYKVGSLKMMELRRRAENELGPRFDIKQFHEWILGSGSMPLSILEEKVARRLSAAPAAPASSSK
jgi:uncharacterized protein (DUF885 family)